MLERRPERRSKPGTPTRLSARGSGAIHRRATAPVTQCRPGDPWRPFVDALSGFMNGAGDRPALGRRLPRLRRRGQRHQLAASRRLRRLHCRPRRRPARRPRNPRHRDLGGAAASGSTPIADRSRRGRRSSPSRPRCWPAARSASIPPADEHLHAASRLPLGLADKIFLSLAEPDAVPPESHLLGRFDSARTGSYYLRPFGRPVVECFLGGVLARELEAAGEDAAVAFVTDELRAPARRRLRPRPRAARGHCLGPGADDPRLLQPRPPRIGRRSRRPGPTGEPSPLLRRRGLLAAGLLDRPRCLGDRHRGGGSDRDRSLSGAASWRNLRRLLPRNLLSVRSMP